jgi:hypothetical protein
MPSLSREGMRGEKLRPPGLFGFTAAVPAAGLFFDVRTDATVMFKFFVGFNSGSLRYYYPIISRFETYLRF